MSTAREAVGSMSEDIQNWLKSAVKTSGAVSPAARATASITPVMMAGMASGRTIRLIVWKRVAPRP